MLSPEQPVGCRDAVGGWAAPWAGVHGGGGRAGSGQASLACRAGGPQVRVGSAGTTRGPPSPDGAVPLGLEAGGGVPDVAEEGSTIPTFTTWKATGMLAAAWGGGPGPRPPGATRWSGVPAPPVRGRAQRRQHGPAVGSGRVQPGASLTEVLGGRGSMQRAPCTPGGGGRGCRALVATSCGQSSGRTGLWGPLARIACPQPPGARERPGTQ